MYNLNILFVINDIMIRIGIDPSINCTGVCVWDTETDAHNYYMIPSKITKKMQSFSDPYIKIIPYTKKDNKGLEYSEKEMVKFDNIYNICINIEKICDMIPHSNIEVYMEGVSYGSTGSAALVDLSFLNASIRMLMKQKDIKFIIVSPTSLKKFACANGQADKDIIIDAWKRMDSNISHITGIKIDDLADSYFLAHYKL